MENAIIGFENVEDSRMLGVLMKSVGAPSVDRHLQGSWDCECSLGSGKGL